MKKIIIILLFILVGCTTLSDNEKHINTWRESYYKENSGIVALEIKTERNLVYYCSGVLISNRSVLTAAHCLDDTSKLNITIIYNCENINDNLCQKNNSNNYYLYPLYSLENKYVWNDIGIIILDHETTNISSMIVSDLLYENSKITLSGFGTRPEKKFGTLYSGIVEIDKFNEYEFSIKESYNGPCLGDSGGPAFIEVNGNNMLIGILSRKNKNIQCGTPAIYTIPSAYLEWIRKIEGIESSIN